MCDFTDFFKRIPTASIIGFFNDVDKRCYLCSSTRSKVYISEVFQNLEMGCFSIPQIQKDYDDGKLLVRIIESCDDRLTALTHIHKFTDKCKSKGFTFYSNKPIAKFKISISVARLGNRLEARVCLVGRNRQNKFLVGIFDDIKSADQFVLDYYGKRNPYLFPVYANNKLTREFMQKYSVLTKLKLRM